MGGGLRQLVQTQAADCDAGCTVITLLLFVLMSDANDAMLDVVHSWHLFPEHSHPLEASRPRTSSSFGFLAIVGFLLGQVIAVNRFSLHGMYRSRLARRSSALAIHARAASEPVHGVRRAGRSADERARSNARPFHIVNATINTVDDHRLANTERLAQVVHVLRAALRRGERRLSAVAEYAGGVTSVTRSRTSGAAVNSNMGADASGAQTFLLTVFNARLACGSAIPANPAQRAGRSRCPVSASVRC
jgi:hypothetical protein